MVFYQILTWIDSRWACSPDNCGLLTMGVPDNLLLWDTRSLQYFIKGSYIDPAAVHILKTDWKTLDLAEMWIWPSGSGKHILKPRQFDFAIISPWKTFKQTWISFTQRCFVPRLVSIFTVRGSLEENENVKSLQTYGQMDDAQQVIRRAHLTIQLRWAKNY